ncbi:MAG TPA: VOC family protein [Candidatus Acidoferrum sp.]|nr:VOC family protein [Candidatus Acidoferrum sp.]
MRLARFDHINLLTSDIDGMREFLVSVLGVKPGWRPPFRSPGYWLYDGDNAIFHVSDAKNHEQTHVDDIGAVKTGGRATVDHICFRCEGYRETVDRLSDLGIAFHEEDVPYTRDRQIFVDGPDNITFELLFTPADVEAGGGAPIASGGRH